MLNTYSTKKTITNLLALMAISTSLTAAGHWQTSVISGGGIGFELDGITHASYNLPMDIALDNSGNIYVAEWSGKRVSKIDPKTGNILATAGGFANPKGVTVDSSGNIYMTDPNSSASGFAGITPSGGPLLVTSPGKDVQKITFDANGYPTTVTIAYGAYEMYRDGTTAHDPYVLNPPYGTGNDALFYTASYLTYKNGNLYVSDFSNIRKIDLNAGMVSTIAGGDFTTAGYADGTNPKFFDPMGIAVNSKGVVYVADQYNKAVRKLVQDSVSGQWTVSTLVKDDANFIALNGLTIDNNDNIYLAATNHGRIYKIVDNGSSGTASVLFDSPAYGVACDNFGDIYTADSDGFIRKHTLVITPVANDDTISGDENTTITGSLSVTYPDRNALTYSLVEGENEGPDYGHVEIDKNSGTYTYTPNPEYHGPDKFTYQVDDSKGGTSQATVNITVNSVNDTVALPGDIEVAQGAKISAAFNVQNFGNDKLIFTILEGPTHGTVMINTDGTYTYTPNRDYNGDDSFTYQVDDGNKGPAPQATIHITVNENTIPVVSNGSIPASAGGDRAPVPITSVTSGYNGTLHATDTDGQIKAYSIIQQPAHGKVELTNATTGTYTYTCNNPNFTGTDSFQFIATDDVGAISDPATVTITVSKPDTSQWLSYYANQEVQAISNTLKTIKDKGLLSAETFNAASQIVSQGAAAIKAALTGTVNALQSAFTSFYNSLFG